MVEELALGHEADQAARRVGREAAVDEVHVPDVVDREQDAAGARDVLGATQVDLLPERPEGDLGRDDDRRVGDVAHRGLAAGGREK